jgi:hypothetical protein
VEDILFIVSSGQEDGDTAQLAHRVLQDSSSTYPQLSNIRSIRIPVQRARLQDWSCWLAVEVVDQWLNAPSTGNSVDTVLASLGLATSENKNSNLLNALSAGIGGASLSSELLWRINSIRDQSNQLKHSPAELQQWLEQKNIELSNWFSPTPKDSLSQDLPHTGLDRVQFNTEALQIKTELYFKEALVSWRQAGLHLTLEFLQALGERLTNIYADYNQQRQTYKSKEASAWRAFNNLRVQLQQRSFMGRKRSVTFDAVLQGLLKAYSFKLESEIYSQACQIVGKLRQKVHLLAFEFVQANDFLKQLKDDFRQSSPSEELFFAPLLKQSLTQQLDPIKFRREVEGVLGSSCNNWGTLRQSQEAIIRQQILSQLNPLCLEVYTKCYANLITTLQAPNSQVKHSLESIGSLDPIDSLNGSRKQQESNSSQDRNLSQATEQQEELIESDAFGQGLVDSSQKSFVVDRVLNSDHTFPPRETS